MAFDIKAKVEEIVEKIKKDPKLITEFQNKPIPTVEKLIGVDLPDDTIMKIVELVKAKLDMDKVSNMLGGLGGLFGKK